MKNKYIPPTLKKKKLHFSSLLSDSIEIKSEFSDNDQMAKPQTSNFHLMFDEDE